MARIWTAAFGEWQHAIAARHRRRRLMTSAAAVALAASVLLAVRWWPDQSGASSVQLPLTAMLTAATGSVEREDGLGSRPPLEPGAGVTSRDHITTGPNVVAAFALAGNSMLRVNENTRLRIDSPTVIALERGTVYLDAGANTSGGSLEVLTHLGTIRDIGTRFEVQADDARVRVRVRDGEVVLARGTSAHRARRGTEITVYADSVAFRAVPLFGEDWAWIARLPETFALDGRSLTEFLDWVARETGFAVSFESDELAARAKSIVLEGTIDGLTAEEALDVVLPATGLEHHVSDGRVIVRAQKRGVAWRISHGCSAVPVWWRSPYRRATHRRCDTPEGHSPTC
jgi:ferric-dicitrate binding protein FerR (iron transport regulator)